jgi:hypothetical protein
MVHGSYCVHADASGDTDETIESTSKPTGNSIRRRLWRISSPKIKLRHERKYGVHNNRLLHQSTLNALDNHMTTIDPRSPGCGLLEDLVRNRKAAGRVGWWSMSIISHI